MINFISENIEMPVLDFDKVCDWLRRVAAERGFIVGRLTYCFCDDAYILDTNRKFLNHDYFTDIITFDYSHGEKLNGDMVISLDTVASNAESLGESYDRELLRVIVHGLLHLCGIDDKGPGEREIMELAENESLAIY